MHQGNFSKIRYSEIATLITYTNQLTDCPALKIKLLVLYVHILSFSKLTIIFFTLLLFIIMISLLPSFIHTVARGASYRCFKYTYTSS